jgi:hypothetical protein
MVRVSSEALAYLLDARGRRSLASRSRLGNARAAADAAEPFKNVLREKPCSEVIMLLWLPFLR